MENFTPFIIKNGGIESSSMSSTKEFMNDNLKYLVDAFKPIRSQISKTSQFSFVCYEDNWSFAARVDNMELGAASEGAGGILEGQVCEYDSLFERLEKL